jgi:hypothetical protein
MESRMILTWFLDSAGKAFGSQVGYISNSIGLITVVKALTAEE